MSKILSTGACTSLLLLTACGGGSSSSDANDNNPPPINTFTLRAVIENSCGKSMPYMDVELLLQDQNWQLISRHASNENGEISLTTPSSTINYTLVAKSQTENQDEGIEAISYFGVNASNSVTYVANNVSQQDNSLCECQTNDLVLSHPRINSLSDADSSAQFSHYEAITGTSTKFIDVQVCRSSDQEWPQHSFMVQGPDSGENDTASAGFGSGLNDISAFETAATIAFDKSDVIIETEQIFNQMRHFQKSIAAKTDHTLLFDNHAYSDITTYKGNADVVFEEYSTLFGVVKVNSTHQVLSTQYYDALELEPNDKEPNIDLERLTEIQADGQFDYSAVSNHEMAMFTFDYRAKHPQTQLDMPATWTIYGPIEGQLPIVFGLPGYENIIDHDTSIKATYVNLIRSYNHKNYTDYINYYAKTNGDLVSRDLTNSFANDRHFYNISIVLK